MPVPTGTASGLVARIIELRAANGLRQRDLADALGIDPSSMSRIEKGERAVSVGELIRLADALGVRVEDLLAHELAESTIWLRAAGEASSELSASLELFRAVIRDFFGAQAAVE